MDPLLLAPLVALGLGLASSVGPGPLLTLVVATTLERGFAAGLRVALSPFVTDAPLILVCFLVLRSVPGTFLTFVTLVGGGFVIYLGIETFGHLRRPPRIGEEALEEARSTDLWRGALVNVLSPSPWLFWLGVGVPEMIRLAESSWILSISWATLFVAGLSGGKVGLAWIIARGRGRLDGRWYRLLLGACGAFLLGFGAWLLWLGALEMLDILVGS